MINHTDDAILSPEDDKLGLAPLAAKLVKGLVASSAPSSVVCSVQGDWGSGKSSFLNFMSYYLQESQKTVIRLNPWVFSGRSDIVSILLKEISLALKESDKKIAEKIYEYSLIFDKHSKLDLSLNLDEYFDKYHQSSTVSSVRLELESLLSKKKEKIFILIDDLDRLSHKEINEVLRLVSVVADFPFFNFIITMDRTAVETAITQERNLNGERFLEKIIQVPFSIPHLSLARLISFFEYYFFKVVDQSLNPSQLEYAKQVFHQSLFPFISKPRDVVRLINRFSFSYGALSQETNPVDLVVLDFYYLKFPQVYNFIKENEFLFIDLGVGLFSEQRALFEKKLTDLFPDEGTRRKWVKALGEIFPDVRKYKMEAVSSYLILEQEQCVHNDRYFYNYFTFNVEDQEITNSLIKKFIEILATPKEIDTFIKKYLTPTQVFSLTHPLESFLIKLREHLSFEAIMEEHKKTVLIDVIFKIAKIIKGETERSLKESNEKILFDILWMILSNLSEDRRYQALKTNMEKSSALFFNVFVVKNLSYQQKSSQKDIIKKAEMKILEDKALENIEIDAQNFSILKDEHLLSILDAWHYFLRKRYDIKASEVSLFELTLWQKELLSHKKRKGMNQLLKFFIKSSPDSSLNFDRDNFERFFNRELFLKELEGELSEVESLFETSYSKF